MGPGFEWLREGLPCPLGAPPVDEKGSLPPNDLDPLLIQPAGADRYDAAVRPGLGLPELENLGLGVEGVTDENRVGETNLIPPEVGERQLRCVDYRLTGDDRQGQVSIRLAVYRTPIELLTGRRNEEGSCSSSGA